MRPEWNIFNLGWLLCLKLLSGAVGLFPEIAKTYLTSCLFKVTFLFWHKLWKDNFNILNLYLNLPNLVT